MQGNPDDDFIVIVSYNGLYIALIFLKTCGTFFDHHPRPLYRLDV
jgi:hypothetical protein